jgi:hypothetical protein
MSEPKINSPQIQGEYVLGKLNKDFDDKKPDFFVIDLILGIDEISILLLNQIFQKRIVADKTFKDYFLIVLDNNMKLWKKESDVVEKFKAFKISQHFLKDKDILKILHDFEESITKK